ncbi:MAG: hypothetical protein COV73_03560 [Candidatus Omnitrophica bacterium CG11_big_fil_rev_8_21_14_0_20_43_6]|nr:MAG: hypothetical protein COV73_03560 [Candidatus Omnitrophica bacterium CG11_big_fil_rev_8_21_14_0_20_43_6]
MESKGWIVSKELPDYDGHLKSVIKLENLSSAQLEMGKEMAACAWNDHLRKRALWQDNIVKFYSRVKKEGISSALSKSLIYLKSHILAHDLIGADYEKPKSYDDVVNGVKLGQADIFLIECPPWDIAMPPLGIAYLASYLKKHRYKVRVFDLNIALYNLASSNTKRLWEQKNYGEWIKEGASPESASSQLKDVVEVVLNKLLAKVHIDCIGLSVNFASIPMVLIILKIIKSIKPKVKIILGGWGCINAHMRSFFPAGLVDIFVIGEGEATLLEIMKMLKGRKKESEVSGAIFNHQSVIQYEPRMPIMDLNLIPWPDFREFNLKHYHSRTIPLFTSRGCISKCNFCNDWAISKPYRYRDARLVFEEMKYHVKINRTTTFSLKDLLCNGNMKNLNLLADLIINSGLKIGWDSQAITHKEMTDEILCKLKRAGCETLVYGIESFSNNVLKRMGKLFTSQIAEEVLRNTYKAQIRSCVNLIVGFPGETEIDFQETLQALERNIQYISQIGAISVCLVNHNSDLENNHQHYGLILSGDTKIRAKEWTICTDLNTYQLRQARARQILALISKAGLKYETLTI